MRDAKAILDQYFLEMRWRCLSLAADLDRVERAGDGKKVIADDPRLAKLKKAMRIVMEGSGDRAEQVQALFSDRSPPPGK